MSSSLTDRPVARGWSSQLEKAHRRLRRRVEDLEDLRDLNASIERNAGKPGIPWAQVKKEIGL